MEWSGGEKDCEPFRFTRWSLQTSAHFSHCLSRSLPPSHAHGRLAAPPEQVQNLDMFRTLPEEVGAAFQNGSYPFLPRNDAMEWTHRNITGTSCSDPERVARFEEIASSIKRDAKMEGVLVNLQVAPAAVVCYAYPLNNTEDFDPPVFMDSTKIPGHDLLTDPQRSFIAEVTVPRDEIVIAGPLTLRQGGSETVKTGFIARLPINALTEDQVITVKGIDYKKWGFAVAIINWKELVDRSDINERFAVRGMQYQLTRTDRKTNEETGQVEIKASVVFTIKCPHNYHFVPHPHRLFQQCQCPADRSIILPEKKNLSWLRAITFQWTWIPRTICGTSRWGTTRASSPPGKAAPSREPSWGHSSCRSC